jgi:hypothetical protein
MANQVELAHTRLLVTLAQTVLVMHQTSYLPSRLREQLVRQVSELEALTERYAQQQPGRGLRLVEQPDRPKDPAA